MAQITGAWRWWLANAFVWIGAFSFGGGGCGPGLEPPNASTPGAARGATPTNGDGMSASSGTGSGTSPQEQDDSTLASTGMQGWQPASGSTASAAGTVEDTEAAPEAPVLTGGAEMAAAASADSIAGDPTSQAEGAGLVDGGVAAPVEDGDAGCPPEQEEDAAVSYPFTGCDVQLEPGSVSTEARLEVWLRDTTEDPGQQLPIVDDCSLSEMGVQRFDAGVTTTPSLRLCTVPCEQVMSAPQADGLGIAAVLLVREPCATSD